ncbi:hypothetical protein BgiMline_001290 [Biomphalaria glabrata]|nr:hypothetical protein BgiMline_001197 [Biomphalaria glabrata]
MSICYRRSCKRDPLEDAQKRNLEQFCATASTLRDDSRYSNGNVASQSCTLPKGGKSVCRPCGQPTTPESYSCRPCGQPKAQESYSCKPCGQPKATESYSCRPCSQPKAQESYSCRPCGQPKSQESYSCKPTSEPKMQESYGCRPCGQSKRQENYICRPCGQTNITSSENSACLKSKQGKENAFASTKSSATSSCSTGRCCDRSISSSMSNVCVVAPERATACGHQKAQSSIRNSTWARLTTPSPCSRYIPHQEKSQNQDSVAIGTYVHIAAIQDKFRPAGQTTVQRIAAVVMYVTSDSMYQVGTRKGVIGRLFSRDELDVRDYHKFTIKDVPDVRINMHEASTMAF